MCQWDSQSHVSRPSFQYQSCNRHPGSNGDELSDNVEDRAPIDEMRTLQSVQPTCFQPLLPDEIASESLWRQTHAHNRPVFHRQHDRASPLNSIGVRRPTRNRAVVCGSVGAVPRDCNRPMAKVTGTLPLAVKREQSKRCLR